MALASKLRLSKAVPQVFPDATVDMALVRRVARRPEVPCLESLWTGESILSDVADLDSLVLLSYVAAVTSTARLGVSVAVFPLHSPFHAATRVASLDQASGAASGGWIRAGPPTPGEYATSEGWWTARSQPMR